MLRHTIALTLLAGFALPVMAETLLISSPKAKACGEYGYSYRAGYTIESFENDAGGSAAEKHDARLAAIKAANAAGVHTQTVSPGQCIAVARMDKKINACEFRTFYWIVASDAGAAKAAMERMLAREVNLKNSAVQEVRCAKPHEDKDTTWAIRG